MGCLGFAPNPNYTTQPRRHADPSHHTLPSLLSISPSLSSRISTANKSFPPLLSNQPQLPIKRLRTRLPPQKVLQCLHFLLTPPLLQHHMPIPPTLLLTHRILCPCLPFRPLPFPL